MRHGGHGKLPQPAQFLRGWECAQRRALEIGPASQPPDVQRLTGRCATHGVQRHWREGSAESRVRGLQRFQAGVGEPQLHRQPDRLGLARLQRLP